MNRSENRSFDAFLYSGTATARLWRSRRARIAPILTLALAVGCGGCSMSYQMDSLLGSSSKTETTGSINKLPPGADAMAKADLPPDADLAYAKAAASEVLRRGGKDTSQPWENPHSGARGTVTPIATPYEAEGASCREFLASYVRGGKESWLRGEACSREKGRWEIRSLKPSMRS